MINAFFFLHFQHNIICFLYASFILFIIGTIIIIFILIRFTNKENSQAAFYIIRISFSLFTACCRVLFFYCFTIFVMFLISYLKFTYSPSNELFFLQRGNGLFRKMPSFLFISTFDMYNRIFFKFN